MDLDKYFESINRDEIDRYVNEHQEEHGQLDFKTVNFPSLVDKARRDDAKNYGKALSGFANSTGGIIIWGVICSKNSHTKMDCASGLKPISELTGFLNWLNRMETVLVSSGVLGVQHFAIPDSNNPEVGFVKTYIPSSEGAPHMYVYDGENCYYKRFGDSFIKCQNYEVLDILNRQKRPCLSLDIEYIGVGVHWNNSELWTYGVKISIVNTGKVLAKHPFLKINSNIFNPSRVGLNRNGLVGLNRRIIEDEGEWYYFGGNEYVIYPNLKFEVDIFYALARYDKPAPYGSFEYKLIAENMDLIEGYFEIDFKEEEIKRNKD